MAWQDEFGSTGVQMKKCVIGAVKNYKICFEQIEPKALAKILTVG